MKEARHLKSALRILPVMAVAIGMVSIAFPWWTMRYTWDGGAFEMAAFVEGNRATGDISGLGLDAPIQFDTAAYGFASNALVLLLVAVAISGVAAIVRRGMMSVLLVLSCLFFAASLFVFGEGMAAERARQGGLFVSRTLSFEGSTSQLSAGLDSGFYVALLAALINATAFLVTRRQGSQRGVERG